MYTRHSCTTVHKPSQNVKPFAFTRTLNTHHTPKPYAARILNAYTLASWPVRPVTPLPGKQLFQIRYSCLRAFLPSSYRLLAVWKFCRSPAAFAMCNSGWAASIPTESMWFDDEWCHLTPTDGGIANRHSTVSGSSNYGVWISQLNLAARCFGT